MMHVTCFMVHVTICCSTQKLVLVTQSFLTLCNLIIDHQAPLSMGILQTRIPEWVAITFSRGSFQSKD